MADDGGGGEHGASGSHGCVFCNGTAPPGISPADYKPMFNGPSLLGVNGTVTDYEEWKFSQFALTVIREHNSSDKEHPLFLNYNMHVIHEPLQAPHSYFAAQAVRTNATYPDAPQQPRAICKFRQRLFLDFYDHPPQISLPSPPHCVARNECLTRKSQRPDHAMVKFADDVVGNFTALLKSKDMWNDTLVVITSDK